MEKLFIKFIGISLLSVLLFVSGATFGNYEVKASQKRVYHSDMDYSETDYKSSWISERRKVGGL